VCTHVELRRHITAVACGKWRGKVKSLHIRLEADRRGGEDEGHVHDRQLNNAPLS